MTALSSRQADQGDSGLASPIRNIKGEQNACQNAPDCHERMMRAKCCYSLFVKSIKRFLLVDIHGLATHATQYGLYV